MENVLSKIKTVLYNDNWQIQIATAGGALVLFYAVHYAIHKNIYSRKRQRKRIEQVQQLEKLKAGLNKVEGNKVSEITNLTAEQIISCIRTGKYSCVDVLNAFQCKALQAHNSTNCLVQPIAEAEELALKVQHDDQSKLLYGLPVSLKDNFGFKNYDATVGLSKWIDRPFQEDCVIVKVLKSQGAVPFVKTNVPQTMLSWECTNPIYGATTNPLDKTRGVGGSTGGEAALLAMKGSVLGFGGDIGGSIRIPAAMCGVVGLKPTYGRLSPKGLFPLCQGQQTCPSSVGPMARDVDTLALAMNAVCVPLMWELDPDIPPMPFNEEVYHSKRPLKIGYYCQDGYMEIVPAMQRGVLKAKALLESMGHTVTEWKIPKNVVKEIVPLWGKIIFGDQGTGILSYLKHDAADSSSKTLVALLKLPVAVKKFLSLIFRPLMPRVSDVLTGVCGCGSVQEMWDVIARKDSLKMEIIQSWRDNEFDAIIAPGFTCTAVPNGFAGRMGNVAYCTALYNTLNFTAGSIPVTAVNMQDEKNMEDYPVSDLTHFLIKKAMKDSVGLPVNVQVVTLPWQEELCLRVMKDIETSLEKSK